ncbi:MAG: hypothetical protein KAG97_04125, partial [Victivallales bacterium]|nr:hypothetical protein [Victivallales bacterium]
LIGALIGLIFSLVFIIATWKVFTKAGQPGWAAIVPIYNMIVLWQISRQPVWALVFCFLPFLNIVGTIMISLGVAKSFGKGGGFGIGLWLFSIIFYPILGFGSSEYQDS